MPKPSDRWIPWYFFAFFTVLVLILVPVCILAFRTDRGVITNNAYEKGLTYNKALQAAAEQKELGWHGQLSTSPAGQDNEFKIGFSLSDKSGHPLDATVKLWLIRPTQSGIDIQADMKSEHSGRYTTIVKLPMHGLWDAHISAQVEKHNYQMTKRIVLP